MMTLKDIQLDKTRLTNGSLLLFNRIEGAPRLAIYIFLPGGNTLDATPGMSDLVDRLLMKGTKNRTQEQLSIELDGLTLDVDVDTKRDFSMISATLLEEDLDASLEIISDFFYEATLVEFDREKQKIAGELAMELDSPRARASDLFIRTVFAGTNYGTTSSVFLDRINDLNSVDDAFAHYHRIYQPSRMIISVSGDIDRNRVVDRFEHYFGQVTAEAAPLDPPDAPLLRKHTISGDQYVTFARDDSNQAHIYKGWLGPKVEDEDFYPMAVLNTLLGAGGLSSRLFMELRDKQGLAYHVRSSFDAYRHSGLFYIYIGTEPKNKEKCLKGFIDECRKVMDIPVSEKELTETKQNILGRRTVFLETASQQASYIGSNFIMGRGIEDIHEMPARINAVTAQDIQRVAQKYLSQPAVISVVGPSAIL